MGLEKKTDCFICERIEMIKDGENPYFVKELETGYVVLGDHQHFNGYTLFLCKEHTSELHFLEKSFKQKHLGEMSLVAEAVYKAFKPEKLNIELLGNGESHVHWHIFPRMADDISMGKGPVWWMPVEEMYADSTRPSAEELKKMVEKLNVEIQKCLK